MNPPPQPPPIDDGQLCTAHFTVTGTFAPGTTPRPLDPDTQQPITGCWPVGQWTFTAAVASNTCAAAPAVIPSYSFKVERTAATDGGTDTTQTITNLTSLTAPAAQAHLSVSSTGQGCEGSLELGSTDGTKYWNMKPTLSKDPAARTLAGAGDYDEYKVDAWPWKGQ
jgi:hypothetical protein